MTSASRTLLLTRLRTVPVPVFIGAVAFLVAFAEPMVTLGRDWWSDPDSGHGLLLFPVAVWLGWRRGLEPARPQPVLGTILLASAVLLRYMSGLAAELFTMRGSLIGAAIGLVVYWRGMGQVRRWWLPLALLVLSVPLPDVLLGSLALPLQFKASQWGTALLEMRQVPVRLAGNVISLPGRSLFVTEACSGLRSLTALIALGLLVGGLWLRSWWGRSLLVLAAIPVAMALNAVRIFLTGFVVFFVDPSLAEGVMHYTEGWAMFVVAFAVLGLIAVALTRLERLTRRAVE